MPSNRLLESFSFIITGVLSVLLLDFGVDSPALGLKLFFFGGVLWLDSVKSFRVFGLGESRPSSLTAYSLDSIVVRFSVLV
jgi:hypothetical protein